MICRLSFFGTLFLTLLNSLNLRAHPTGTIPAKELPPLGKRDMQTNPLYLQADNPHTSPDVTVTINYTSQLLKSNVTFGVTHTHYKWQSGNTAAIAKAKELMKSLDGFHNTHIMSWGPTFIITDNNGLPLNLDDPGKLTQHVKKVVELGQGVITFCTAPGWMKPSGNGDPNSRQGDTATDEAVLPQYEDAFATLCAAIAQKYTHVKYFQIIIKRQKQLQIFN